ncbi:MAG: hypothetical protein ACR2F1_01410 [Nitrososphaeraceae archaeon]
MSKSKMTILTISAMLMTTTIMYTYPLAHPILLKPSAVSLNIVIIF